MRVDLYAVSSPHTLLVSIARQRNSADIRKMRTGRYPQNPVGRPPIGQFVLFARLRYEFNCAGSFSRTQDGHQVRERQRRELAG